MLKLKYKSLNNPNFVSAMRKLYHASGLGAEVAYRAEKIASNCEKEMKKAQELAVETLKKHAKLDEKGVPIGMPDGPFSFESKEKEDLHDKEFLAIMDKEFEIKANKLPLRLLSPAALTPAEMGAIECVLEVPEEV